MSIKTNVKLLRKAMVDKNITTISELARQSGVSRPKIHEYMREDSPLSTTFKRLCDFLDVDPSQAVIVDGENNEE